MQHGTVHHGFWATFKGLSFMALSLMAVGCVVESYPVSATATRRTPKPTIPHPMGVDPVAAPIYSSLPEELGTRASTAEKAIEVDSEKVTGDQVLPSDVGVVSNEPVVAVEGIKATTPQTTHQTPGQISKGLDVNFLRYGELSPDVMPVVKPTELRRGVLSSIDNPRAVQRVTFADEGADSDVSPDRAGRFIVFASTRHRATSDLYLQRTGSAAVTQLTSDPANDVMPAVDPDGKRMAFASDRGGTWDLYLTDLGGGPTVRLTDDGAQNLHPSFSADGKRLVYCSRTPRSGVWELVLIDLANPSQRQLIGHGLFPAFSPTDDRIVYQRARERGSRWFSLWTLDLQGENPGPPTEIAASSNAALITPAWSPDGTQVVFCTVLEPTADSNGVEGVASAPQADVWVCNANGAGRARLTRGGFAHLQPAWSSKGSIYFISNRGTHGTENVYALHPEGEMLKHYEATVPVMP